MTWHEDIAMKIAKIAAALAATLLLLYFAGRRLGLDNNNTALALCLVIYAFFERFRGRSSSDGA